MSLIPKIQVKFSHLELNGTSAGDRKIQKIEASRIQEETGIKFIFFKKSLTTGWDCPRAEVMMSFRRAYDHTLIAQLIGRMIRTPLARRIEWQELLNSVSLYLPHYDAEGLQQVIENLRQDPDAVPPTDVERGDDQITLRRRVGCEDVFKILEDLPTYRVEKTRKASHTRRLMKLSRLLTAMHDIDPDALDDSKKLVLDTLASEMARLRAEEPEFGRKVRSYNEITVRAVTVEQGIWKELSSEPMQVVRSDANVDDLFHRIGQRVGEGLHLDYWQANYDEDDPNRPKLELFLTLQDQKTWENLEKACAGRINALFEAHKNAIKKLKSSEREQYNKIREIAKDPEVLEFVPPNEVIVTIDKGEAQAYCAYHKHLYVGENGKYLTKLNSWEKALIEAEIARDDVVGWLRNYERKPWALSLPYEYAGETRPMYPDFLVIRKNGSAWNVDILEPHASMLADSWAKAKGLAGFATKHGDHFGRIELIRMAGNSLKRLDLNDDKNRKKVLAVNNNQHLDQIFDGL